jgi:hypothetical protein
MFSKALGVKNTEFCAYRLGSAVGYARAYVSSGKVELTQLGLGKASSLSALGLAEKNHLSVLLLGPEAYSASLVPTPVSIVELPKLHEALRWTLANDSSIDLEHAVCDFLHVAGSDVGGALLKDSYWVFAVERAMLTSLMQQSADSRLKIEVVDTVATAQRNLCYSEVRGGDASRDGCYASLVVGDGHSSLNIASFAGDLLFHKQMEWSSQGLNTAEVKDRLVVDLQRNLGYFERRLASFALIKGFVFGAAASELADYLSAALSPLAWAPAVYPEVVFANGVSASSLSGDDALLLGSLMRWA